MLPARGGIGERRPSVEPPAQPVGQAAGVAGGHDQVGCQSLDAVRQAPHVGDHDGRAAGQGLQHHQAETLERRRRHHGDVRGLVESNQLGIGEGAGKPGGGEDAELGSPSLEAGSSGPVAADDQQSSVHRWGRQLRPRLEQAVDAHPGDQPADAADHLGIGGQAESPACLVAGSGAEKGELDGRGDDLHPPRRDPVALDQHLAEGVGQSDDHLRPAVHRPFHQPLHGGATALAPAARRLPTLVGPRPVKVDDQGEPAQATKGAGNGGVEGKVGVDHRRRASRRPGGAPVGHQPAEERGADARGHVQAGRWAGHRADGDCLHGHAAGAEGGDQAGNVPVEAACMVR